MSLSELVLAGRSKAHVDKVLEAIGSDMKNVNELVALVQDQDKTLAFNAGWALYHLIDRKDIEWALYFDQLWSALGGKVQPVVDRAILKYLWYLDEWPEETFTEIADKLFNYVADPKSKIAYQALSMEALFKHLKPYPELLEELRLILEQGLPYGSAGYKAKANKILRSIIKSN